MDPRDILREHISIHMMNPTINYVRINSCPYCIRDRRMSYRNSNYRYNNKINLNRPSQRIRTNRNQINNRIN